MLALSMLYIEGNHKTQTVSAFSYQKSSNVAMVPDEWSWSENPDPRVQDGGGLYVATDWPNGDNFTFTNTPVDNIENDAVANPLIGYDTVVLWATRFNFGDAWNNPVFSSRIRNFVSGGGKLIIYTSEINSQEGENANAFSNFIYPFTIDSPGRTYSRGVLTNLENNTFSSSNPADESYINFSRIMSETDVGDATVMVSYDSNWYIDLFAVNYNNVGGPVHAYAFYGAGLIIFNGLDVDDTTVPKNSITAPIDTPSNDNGGGAIEMIWWRELSAQSLSPSVNVNGLTVDPVNAVNLVNIAHTVTATVRNTVNNNLIPDVLVNFSITAGPNMGSTGQGITNASGQTTFSWSSSAAGMDMLSVSIPNSNPGDPAITTIATKTWVISGPLSVSVSPSNWIMDLGQTKEFVAIPNGGSLNYRSYQWYVNGSVQNNQIMPTFVFTPTSTGFYLISVTVTDTNTTSPQSDNATVIVNEPPAIADEDSSSSSYSSSSSQSSSSTSTTSQDNMEISPEPIAPDSLDEATPELPVLPWSWGWLEIAILIFMGIVLLAVILGVYRSFKEESTRSIL
jgi:hypothetical protein